MANPYYTAGGTPATGSFGASQPIRSEFAAIQAGFALLPQTFTANKAVVINSAGDAMGLTTGSLVLAGDFTTTGNFGVVLAASAAVTLTLPAVSGTLATLAGTESLSNKTLVSVVLGTPASGNLANCTDYPTSGLSGALPAANFPVLTGDVTTPGASLATTLATVNSNVGSFGGSTAIPVITVNGKGLVTAVSTAAVVAPAGTLSGATLAAGVTASSLTSVGTIATGVWQGSVISATYGGTGLSSLGAGVATFLGVPSSTNLAAAVTGETGSGALVFGTSPQISFADLVAPTLSTATLGTPDSGYLVNCTGYPASALGGTLLAAQFPALTGDITTSVGSIATTLATVASAGTTGSSTAIPVITIDAKGRTTSITTAAVVAPAGTLTGATLASGVTASSLTSFGANPVVGTQSAGDSSTKAASTAFVQAATGKVYVQVFTGDGTYTPHAGMINCIIECIGGGGGGGGVTGDVGWMSEAAGGGAGGYSRLLATAAAIGASKAVTMGTAGAGGTAGNNNGSAGGDTSVGVLCIAKGGSGGGYTDAGAQVGTGGLGGVAGTGTATPTGAPGGSGWTLNSASGTARGAPGGNSFLGGGGLAPIRTTAGVTTGTTATNYGGGGAGACALDTATTAAGGAGAAGYVIVTEFCDR